MSSSPQEQLFRSKKLRSLCVGSFRDFEAKQGWTDGQAWEQTWTDADGHRWSTLSRLGYLLATDNRLGRFPGLLAEGLRHHGQRGLVRQTEPGEPDLLWAWLGYNNLCASASTQHEMKQAFFAVHLETESGLATGTGLCGDGGWVDQALTLLETLAKREGTPHWAMRWWKEWIDVNLLNNDSPAQQCWWELGWRADFRKPARKDGLPWHSGRSNTYVEQRPDALTRTFDSSWARIVRLGALLLRHAPHRSKSDGFPCGISNRGDSMGLAEHLGSEAWEALADFLRAAALERPDQAASGAVVEATNLWLTGPRTHLSAAEMLALAKRLALPQTDLQPGEPEGSVADWNRHNVSPVLHAWLNEQMLQAALPPTEPPSPARLRTRL